MHDRIRKTEDLLDVMEKWISRILNTVTEGTKKLLRKNIHMMPEGNEIARNCNKSSVILLHNKRSNYGSLLPVVYQVFMVILISIEKSLM